MTMKNVLFLGTGNAARSIMAEAYMNHAGRGLYRAFSAGAEPAGAVDPAAIEILRDVGIRGRNLSSKSWQVFALTVAPKMDVIVTVCERTAESVMPRWPGTPDLRHWRVMDPIGAAGSSAQRRSVFLDCFADLRQHVDALLLSEPPLGALMEQAARGEVMPLDA
jgi:arsenate reductase